MIKNLTRRAASAFRDRNLEAEKQLSAQLLKIRSAAFWRCVCAGGTAECPCVDALKKQEFFEKGFGAQVQVLPCVRPF